MTLESLWLMAQGRRSEWRMMLLLQAGAIDRLFSGQSLSDSQIEQFLRTGSGGTAAVEPVEPKHPLVDELVAKALATGRIIVESS